jgi:hypothetical protein
MASFLQSAGTGLLQGVGTSMYQRGQSKMDQEAAKIKAMREANLKRLELEHEDKVREQKWEREDNKAAAEASIKDRLNQRDNKTKLKVAAMKAGGKDDSKLGDIPEDVLNDPMLQRLVTDESGEPVLDLNTMQPVMETNWGEVSQIRDMMTQYGIKDWRQGVLLYKREVLPQRTQQEKQRRVQAVVEAGPEKARSLLNKMKPEARAQLVKDLPEDFLKQVEESGSKPSINTDSRNPAERYSNATPEQIAESLRGKAPFLIENHLKQLPEETAAQVKEILNQKSPVDPNSLKGSIINAGRNLGLLE